MLYALDNTESWGPVLHNFETAKQYLDGPSPVVPSSYAEVVRSTYRGKI